MMLSLFVLSRSSVSNSNSTVHITGSNSSVNFLQIKLVVDETWKIQVFYPPWFLIVEHYQLN